MDFGSIVNGIGDFFGGIFNPKKKPDQPRATTPVSIKPQPSTAPFQLNQPTVQAPKPFQLPNTQTDAPQIGGVTLHVAPKPAEQPKPQEENPFMHTLGAVGKFAGDSVSGLVNGAVNTVKLVPDAVIGGAAHLLGNKDIASAADEQLKNDYNASIAAPIVNTGRVLFDATDNGLTRLTGTPEAIRNSNEQLGRSLNSSLLAPISATYDAAKLGLESNASQVNAQQVTSTYLDKMRQNNEAVARGMLSPADAQSANNQMMAEINRLTGDASAKTQQFSALDPQEVASNAANAYLTVEGGIKGTRELIKGKAAAEPIKTESQLADTPTIAEKPVSVPREPNNPITVVPTAPKPPAITTPNTRPVMPEMPQLTAPEVQAPALAGVERPLAPVVDQTAPLTQATPEQAAIKQALDKQTMKAPEAPAPVATAPAEAPSVAASRAMAEQATPASTEALVQAEQAAARAKAPTDAIAELSKTAKNSLENDTTGIKPGGVERSGGHVENGTAKPVEVRTLPDGTKVIVDGRHTLEYARQNGITDFPIKDVTSQYAPQVGKTATVAKPTPLVEQAAVSAPKVEPTVVAAKGVPSYSPPSGKFGKPSVPGTKNVIYSTGEANLDGIVHDSIVATKGTAKTAASRADALDAIGVTASKQTKIRNVAVRAVDKNTGKISPEGVAAIKRILTTEEKARPASPAAVLHDPSAPTEAPVAAPPVDAAPKAAPVGKLGTITRDAVRSGDINTTAGLDKAIADTTTAAQAEATAAGDTIDSIIKKGQTVWEKNPKASPKEAEALVKGFTPEQQQVFKDYGQELKTLRDRSGHSLNGGYQGEWYGPRQFLDDMDASRAYDPSLINELKRSGAKQTSEGNKIDYSTTPYEHYIRRYANAVDAASQRLTNAAETNPLTGEATGVKIPDAAKAKLENSLKSITDKRDAADRLLADGDTKGAAQAGKEIQKDINQAFNDFIDDIPGSGSTRRAAINSVKAERGTYEQTLIQTLTLSNLVNRVADQGTKVVEAMKAPLVRGLEKVINPIMKANAMPGADSAMLNTSKEAAQAAKEFSSGTLGHEIMDNARAVVASAGAGRGRLARGIAKVDATIRAGGAALTQSGDLSTRNLSETLKIGASRPEAAGLKTVADYKRYFADYVKTNNFQNDLKKVEQVQNPKIGLAGGEVQQNSGKISTFLSKYVDNSVSTFAESKKPGLGKNRGIREVNDLVKGNVTGYAGVTSRVLGSVKDAFIPIKPLREAVNAAKSGDAAAAAQATTIAAHAVADTIAAYGSAVAAAAALKTGLIGYTGAQPKMGSSDSAYNKSHNIPANQWYVNIGDKRLYFDPARSTGAPGVAADLVASAVTGSDPASTVANIGGQIFNQAGGNTLPQNIVNANTAFLDPAATDADKKYAQAKMEALAAPSTGVLNNVANWTDPTRRAPTNFGEDLSSNIPGLRAGTPAAKDARGNVIPNSKQVSGGSSLFSLADNPDAAASTGDSLGAEITRLQKAGGNVFPTSANKNAKKDNTDALASGLLQNAIYTSASDEEKAAMLNTVLDGTAGKNINTSLPIKEQQALISHKLLGDKAAAWLSDNTNATDYHSANYDNAKANGTLTKADENLQNKSGLKYKAIEAKVNKEVDAPYELKSLYDQISASDFKDMLDPTSDNYDPGTATKLYNYDQARTKAGVSGAKFTDRAKYSLKASGGNGSKGSKSFGFASLPSSLVGTGVSSTGSYAKGGPLFTPIADLKAPATVAIPKGRTISVKKGVTM